MNIFLLDPKITPCNFSKNKVYKNGIYVPAHTFYSHTSNNIMYSPELPVRSEWSEYCYHEHIFAAPKNNAMQFKKNEVYKNGIYVLAHIFYSHTPNNKM